MTSAKGKAEAKRNQTTIQLFHKPYLRDQVAELKANGEINDAVRTYVAKHGASPTNEYSVLIHGDGLYITVGITNG